MSRIVRILMAAAVVCTVVSTSAMSAPKSAKAKRWSTNSIYTVVKATGPIAIDGKLDESDWSQAEVITDLLIGAGFNGYTGNVDPIRPAKSKTVAKIMYDDENLYFGVYLEDLDLMAYCKDHDSEMRADDVAELFVKPSKARPGYWEFHIEPNGADRDYYWPRRGSGGGDRALPFETGMSTAATVDGTINDFTDRDKGWTGEFRIPLSAFEITGASIPKAGDKWTFMVSRYDYSVYLNDGLELSASASLPRINYHLFETYPTMVFGK